MTFFQVVSIVSNIHPNSNPENGGEEKKKSILHTIISISPNFKHKYDNFSKQHAFYLHTWAT